MEIAEALQLHCRDGATGRATLHDGGRVFLRNGRIVHAESADGRFEGMRALVRLLDCGKPIRGFEHGVTSRTSIADAPGEFTLLDALRLSDERRHSLRNPRTLVERIARIDAVVQAGLLAPGLDPVACMPRRSGWEQPFHALLRPAIEIARVFGGRIPRLLVAESDRLRTVAIRIASGFVCFSLDEAEALDTLLEELRV